MKPSFVARFCNIPLVSSAVDQVGSLYTRGKEQHPLIGLACKAAEFGFKVAVISAQPIIERLEQPLDRLNEIACNQLDKLQSSYPVINSPTEQVIDQVRRSMADVLAAFTVDTLRDRREQADDVELDVQKQDADDASRSVILTWRLSPSNMWLLPNPFVLFSVADKMAVAVEHCFGQFLHNEGASKGGRFVMLDIACTFYCEAVKRLCCQIAVADKFIRAHDLLETLGNAVSIQCIQGLLIVILDWFVSHSPLVFLIPDFSSNDVRADGANVMNNGGIMYDADEDRDDVGGVIGFVPLNPADLAALPVLHPHHLRFDRRYG